MATFSEARLIVPGDSEWPASLMSLDDEPRQLWVRGSANLAELAKASVAIVGARASTTYGETVAIELAGRLASRGVTVISGGAYGIDAEAHRAALAKGLPTIAVLANGLDLAYPPAHATLFDWILEGGGLLVSEYGPGNHPTRKAFLERNRLIAALSRETVIVEGLVRSGSSVTARRAREIFRPVYAVPGSIDSMTAQLPNRLIAAGEAHTLANVDEYIDRFAMEYLKEKEDV